MTEWNYVYAVVDGDVVIGRLVDHSAILLPGTSEPVRASTVLRGVERPEVFVDQTGRFAVETSGDRADAMARGLLSAIERAGGVPR